MHATLLPYQYRAVGFYPASCSASTGLSSGSTRLVYPIFSPLVWNRRGFYGAFLMDNLQLIEQLVLELSQVRGA